MAGAAVGGNCPNCGTAITCAGNATDVMLFGQCPVDGTQISLPNVKATVNDQFVAPAGPNDTTQSAQTQLNQLQAEVTQLQSEIPK